VTRLALALVREILTFPLPRADDVSIAAQEEQGLHLRAAQPALAEARRAEKQLRAGPAQGIRHLRHGGLIIKNVAFRSRVWQRRLRRLLSRMLRRIERLLQKHAIIGGSDC
jgi:hypothetical protein